MLRCEVCRTRRATFTSMAMHKRAAQHGGPCNCGGYHHPHRVGSPCCEDNCYVRANRARREGASDEEVLDAFIDDALLNKHKPSTQKEAPF